MALNPFFQQGSSTEQNLIQDLINEQLKMYGVEVFYLPRQYATQKSVIKEVIESKFENAYPIEAYVDTYDGYNGLGTLMSKFGIQEMDDLTLTISKERFDEYIAPLSRTITDVNLSTRPKEGDLIYFPLGDRLFEIKYVEHEKPFYQLQKNYVYQLTCELFRYEDEVIDTDITEIDDNIQDQGYNITLTMVGVAKTASAFTGLVNNGVRFISITNRGNDYTSAPRVAISTAPSGGVTAVGIATMIDNLVNCYGVTDAKKIQGVELINPGSGYTVAPGVAFFGGGGTGAAATTGISTGMVGVVTVTDGGGGYISEPLVTFSGPVGLGTTATARALISSAGIVTSIRIIDAGSGYSSVPTITIGDPIGLTTSGTFEYNEVVTGSTSGTTARVNSWNTITNVLELKIVSGSFIPGETVVGSASSASRSILSINTDDIIDPYANNDFIESEADSILDFTETNPFGNP